MLQTAFPGLVILTQWLDATYYRRFIPRFYFRLFLSLLVCMGHSLYAQIPHLIKEDLEKELGAGVNVLTQDRLGFTWLGTEKGLYRYDGRNYEAFTLADSNQTSNLISIYADGGRIWCGAETGEIYYLENRKIYFYQPEEGLPKVPVTGLLKDFQGRLWFSTYGEGVYVQDSLHLYNFNGDDGLLGDQIYEMTLGKEGKVWLATDNGVSICQFSRGHKSVDNLTVNQGLSDEIVYTLTPTETGMWIGFQSNGFCHYSTSTGSVDFSVSNWQMGSVRSIAPTDQHRVWIGTENEGVFIYDLRSGAPKRISAVGLAECEQILHDATGNIWLLVDQQFIYRGITRVARLDHELGDIQALAEDNQGRVWIGTRRGLFELVEDNLILAGWEGENIISLYTDRFDKIWIGTFGDGIICWDPNAGRSLRLDEGSGMINGSVFSIDGSMDKIWLATLGGIVSLENGPDLLKRGRIAFSNLDSFKELTSNFFYKVFVDSQGTVWFGTDGQGLLHLEHGRLSNLLADSLLPARTVYSITEDGIGRMWIGTNNEGLFMFDGSNWDHLGIEQGLSNMTITSLAVDDYGNIIIVHENGIDLYNPDHKTFRYFESNAGVDKLNPGLNVVASGLDGIFWIGGQNILVYYLGNQKTDQHFPNLVIDRINLFDKLVDLTSGKEFNYRENYLQFNYTGIWYAASENINYQYQLEGYDLAWKDTRDQSVSYSNLGPGAYTFRVRCLMKNQPLLQSEVSYSFTIALPYWRKAWFIALVVILSAMIIYSYQKYREKQISRQASFERERIESQYEVLKAQINPHFLFNSFNTLANIVEEDKDTAVEYIEKLSDYYRSIIQFRNQKLIPLEQELLLIDDFTYLLKKRFGDNLIVEKMIENRDYYIPPLTLQMLVENAVKHNIISKQKPLKIAVRSESDEYLIVENNLQPKRTKERSTKFGLQNIKTRFELLTRKKVMISQDENTFSVSIPLLKTIQEI